LFHYSVWKELDALLKALHFFELELSVVPLSSTSVFALHKKVLIAPQTPARMHGNYPFVTPPHPCATKCNA